MDIDASEARASLDAARAAESGVRRSLGALGAGYHFLIWGAVCFLCFGATHFAASLPPLLVPGAWVLFEALGSVGSNLVGRRMRRRVASPVDARVYFLWVVFAVFGLAIALVLRPTDGRVISAYVALMTALWMCVMGLWLHLALMWMGIAIAALTLIGAFALRDWYYLWMSLSVGGSMMAAGLVLVAKGGRRGRAR